jgi:hypothetical protein
MSKSSSLGDFRSRRYASPSSLQILLIVDADNFIFNASLTSFTRSKDELQPFLSLVLINMKFFTRRRGKGKRACKATYDHCTMEKEKRQENTESL